MVIVLLHVIYLAYLRRLLQLRTPVISCKIFCKSSCTCAFHLSNLNFFLETDVSLLVAFGEQIKQLNVAFGGSCSTLQHDQ
jgi:hypothetical protein